MLEFNSMDEITPVLEATKEQEIMFKGNVYHFVRRNENVERGQFQNLSCVTFRNDEERHNLKLYFTDNQIEYVETGYSLI